MMNIRQIAIVITGFVLVYLAHAAGRFTQIGGAQVAMSIPVYLLMALLLANRFGWTIHAAIALLVGLLTMVATSSPYPLATLPGHGGPYLLAVYLVRRQLKGAAKEMPVGATLQLAGLTVVLAWTLFAVTTWFGLAGTPFVSTAFSRFGTSFGTGLAAWYLSGFVGVGIPTLIVTLVVVPLLYRPIGNALAKAGQGQGAKG